MHSINGRWRKKAFRTFASSLRRRCGSSIRRAPRSRPLWNLCSSTEILDGRQEVIVCLKENEMAQATETEKTSYQGQMHLLQKEMMGRYFERVTRAAEQGEGKAVYMLISGNPVEL